MKASNIRPYKIGIALSGGGARGFAHIGAIRALEEYGIKPDIISGVSAGSIVGALYASGISPDKILSLFDNKKFNDFCEPCVPQKGLFSLNKLGKFLRKHLIADTFEQLPIPLIICATNLDKSIPISFETGDLVNSVIASCSIPIVFNPININGIYCVDGGVVHNLPAWAIREKCEVVIGINCSPMMNENLHYSLIEIAQRSFEIMACGTAAKDIPFCDILIETTEIANYKVFDISKSPDIYKSGYLAAKEAIINNYDKLKEYI